jgi:hypothetical protein
MSFGRYSDRIPTGTPPIIVIIIIIIIIIGEAVLSP